MNKLSLIIVGFLISTLQVVIGAEDRFGLLAYDEGSHEVHVVIDDRKEGSLAASKDFWIANYESLNLCVLKLKQNLVVVVANKDDALDMVEFVETNNLEKFNKIMEALKADPTIAGFEITFGSSGKMYNMNGANPDLIKQQLFKILNCLESEPKAIGQ